MRLGLLSYVDGNGKRKTKQIKIPWDEIRAMRDAELMHTDKFMMWTDRMTDEQFSELKAYRQALRDATDQPIQSARDNFPDRPTFMEEL